VTNRNTLLSSFDLFLIDAYGVLITGSGTLPGAADFLKEIEERGKTYFIVTNDASRTPETCARVYRDRGLSVPVERILSAGLAISVAFERQNLKGARTAVLGTSETRKT
jgi:ribonucleotide monophosphatase NagD (HAD superfamily)